jgi:hypothetical protein
VFFLEVTQILKIKTSLPMAQIGLVAISPTYHPALRGLGPVGSHSLVVVDANSIAKPSVIIVLVTKHVPHILDGLACRFLDRRRHLCCVGKCRRTDYGDEEE